MKIYIWKSYFVCPGLNDLMSWIEPEWVNGDLDLASYSWPWPCSVPGSFIIRVCFVAFLSVAERLAPEPTTAIKNDELDKLSTANEVLPSTGQQQQNKG